MGQRWDPGGSCPKCGEQLIHRRCPGCGPFPPLRFATFLIGVAILGSFVGRPVNPAFTPSPPTLSPTVSADVAKILEAPPVLHETENKILEAPPVLHETENIAGIQDDAAGDMKTSKEFVPRAEQAKRAPPRALTIEEKAAVARGIRELEEAATRAESQYSR